MTVITIISRRASWRDIEQRVKQKPIADSGFFILFKIEKYEFYFRLHANITENELNS